MMIMVQHHTKYIELHGVDEIVEMTKSDHAKLHQRLRRDGKCNVAPDELNRISHAARNRSPKVKAYQKTYRAEHRDQIKAYNKMYKAEHSEEHQAYNKAYRAEHRRAVNARQRAYRSARRLEEVA